MYYLFILLKTAKNYNLLAAAVAMLSTRLSILFVKMVGVNKSSSAPHSAHKMRTSIFTRVDALRRSTAEFGRVRGVFSNGRTLSTIASTTASSRH